MWVVGIAIVVAVTSVAIGVLLLVRDDTDHDAPSTAARARSRLDDNDGRVYVGTIDDASDPAQLRRALQREFRSDDSRPDRRASADARRCAAALQRTSGEPRGQIVLVGDATYADDPAVVVGITDRGRVVAFVADAETCIVRMAQSL